VWVIVTHISDDHLSWWETKRLEVANPHDGSGDLDFNVMAL
jgi:hypothetical protein